MLACRMVGYTLYRKLLVPNHKETCMLIVQTSIFGFRFEPLHLVLSISLKKGFRNLKF
jgi:hypothetical protein